MSTTERIDIATDRVIEQISIAWSEVFPEVEGGNYPEAAEEELRDVLDASLRTWLRSNSDLLS